MPRPNRFQPGFAERLRQSRIARGQEPAPQPPEPSVIDELSPLNWPGLRELMDTCRHDLFQQAWGMPAVIGTRTHTVIHDEITHNGPFGADAFLAEQRRAMGERIHARIDARIQHLTIPGGLTWDEAPSAPPRHAPVFAPRDGTPIPAPEPIEPIPVLQDNPVPEPARSPAVHPNAQLADALTYRLLHERRVATFLDLLPQILALFKHPRATFIRANYIHAEGDSSCLECRIPDFHPLTPQAERTDALYRERCSTLEADGLKLTQDLYDWGTGSSRVRLWLPGHLPWDARLQPHLHYLANGDCPTPTPLPETIDLRSGYDWDYELIPGLPAPAIYLDNWDPNSRFSVDTPLWHLRERKRELEGDYLPLPAEALAAIDPVKAQGTFPHLATKQANAGMIAYTASPSAGQMDRQQIIKPGRFFKQYGRDHLTDENIKQLSALIRGAIPFEVKLTHDRQDIRRVYAIGPESCMCKGSERNNKAKFKHTVVNGDWVHPVEVFAHPENDLRLAYVETNDGRIGARVWVNIQSRSYERVYDRNDVRGAKHYLTEWLELEGYHHDGDYIEGQKLLRLNSDMGGIICPYIDPGNYGVSVHTDHLLATGGEEANHETGHLNEYGPSEYDWHCDDCDEGHHDGDSQYETIDGETIGNCCVDGYTEVYHLRYRHSVWVADHQRSHYELYETDHLDSGECNWCSYAYPGSNYRLPDHLVVLDSGEYGDNHLAERDNCVLTVDDEWYLEEDMDSDWVFIDELSQWAKKTNCLVLVDANGNAELQHDGVTPSGYDFHDDLDAGAFNDAWAGIDCLAHPDYLATLTEEPEEGEAA